MALREPCALLWDMDGTLVDTAEMHFAAWVAMCQELGRPFTRADFTATFGRRNPEILQELFGQRFDAAASTEIGHRKEALYRTAVEREGVKLLPGVEELVRAAHGEGFRQAIASSAPRANLDLILRLTQLERYFGAIVASEDTQRGKPDPQVFQLAAAKLHVQPSNCVVIEDAVAGVEAARAGGMKCLAVTFVGHHPAAKLEAAGADLLVGRLDQVSVAQLRQLLG